MGTQDFQKNRKNESHISIDNIFPGYSLIFLDSFEVIWYSKMKKYGAPGPKKSGNHEKSKNDVQYDEIEILLDQSEAE